MPNALIIIKSKVKSENQGITLSVQTLAVGLTSILANTCIMTMPTAA